MNRIQYQEWLNNFPEDTEIIVISTETFENRWEIQTRITEEDFVPTEEEIVTMNKSDPPWIIAKLFSYEEWNGKRKLILGKKN